MCLGFCMMEPWGPWRPCAQEQNRRKGEGNHQSPSGDGPGTGAGTGKERDPADITEGERVSLSYKGGAFADFLESGF